MKLLQNIKELVIIFILFLMEQLKLNLLKWFKLKNQKLRIKTFLQD